MQVGLVNGWAVGKGADAASALLTTDSQRPYRAEATSSTKRTEKIYWTLLHCGTITRDYKSQMARLAEKPLLEQTSAS